MTAADFKTRFPEFSTVDDTRIELFIADAILEMSAAAWGTLYEKGQAYLTAHLLTMATSTESGNSGTLNALASHSVEGVSESFAVPSSDGSNTYQATAYGQEYYRLVKIISIGNVSIV